MEVVLTDLFFLGNRHKHCCTFTVSASLHLLERISRKGDLDSTATLGDVRGQHRALYYPNEVICHTIVQNQFGKTSIRSLSLLRRGPLGKTGPVTVHLPPMEKAGAQERSVTRSQKSASRI